MSWPVSDSILLFSRFSKIHKLLWFWISISKTLLMNEINMIPDLYTFMSVGASTKNK